MILQKYEDVLRQKPTTDTLKQVMYLSSTPHKAVNVKQKH